jgi:hypothetical protein
VKKLLILAFLFSLGSSLLAQDTEDKRSKKDTKKEEKKKKVNDLIRQDEEGVLVYRKQSIFGIQLRTNGYGVFYERGKMKTQRNTMVYSLEFNEIKHSKEDKLPNGTGGFSFGNPYVYGKVNNFYSLQLGFGMQRILGQKGNKNGVAVSAVYKGGLSIGLLRPYYIEIDDNGTNKTIKYSPETDSLFQYGFIVGGGGLGKGWGEMKMKPGAFAKTALRFDFGRFNEVVSGVEVGISAEFYSAKIPIMLYQKEKQFFYQGHIAIMFGQRK